MRISDWSSDVCPSDLAGTGRMTMSDIEAIQAQILGEIEAAVDANAVEALRVAALGKAGSITALLKTLGGMSPEERQAQGPAIHALRERVTAAPAARTAVPHPAAPALKLAAEATDTTLPPHPPPPGRVPPRTEQPP